MPTRRSFLAATAGLVAVDLMSGQADASTGSAPAPAATPTPAPGPTNTARCLAKHLQATLPDAKLDDAVTDKIAGDIDGYLDLGKSFRAAKLRNGEEPDFAFSAVEGLAP